MDTPDHHKLGKYYKIFPQLKLLMKKLSQMENVFLYPKFLKIAAIDPANKRPIKQQSIIIERTLTAAFP